MGFWTGKYQTVTIYIKLGGEDIVAVCFIFLRVLMALQLPFLSRALGSIFVRV